MIKVIDAYTEFLLEYDNENLMVYLNGMDKDGFFEEIQQWSEVNSPEDFAHGVEAQLKAQGKFAQSFPSDYLDD